MTERNFVETWGRRVITWPGYATALLLATALSPLLVLIAVVGDLKNRSRWAWLRTLGFLYLYLYVENAGILLGIGIWVFSGGIFGLGRERMLRWDLVLQRWWGGWLFNGTVWLFGMKFDIDGFDEITQGPAMLFFRHVSVADTSLPGALFVLQRKWHVRHIIKRELLWDPSLDLVGNILPNYFVRRGTADSEREIAGVRRLMHGLGESGLGPDESIVIFPEGTRFSPSKREAVLKKLAEKADTYFLEKARALKNVLPPRLGGCLAMLEENTRACAVFVTHVGFEAASRAHNLMNGALIHKTIRIKLWRIPFELIPKTREARVEWLFDQWRRVDEWIGAHLLADNGVSEKAAA